MGVSKVLLCPYRYLEHIMVNSTVYLPFRNMTYLLYCTRRPTVKRNYIIIICIIVRDRLTDSGIADRPRNTDGQR